MAGQSLLAGMAPGQQRRGGAAAAAVLAAVGAIFASGTASFLAHQNARGVEIESVAATPFMIWRQAGWHGTLVYRFGAYQLSGEHVALARNASWAGLVLAAAAVIGWRLLIAGGRARWRPEFAADAPLAATLLFLVASPVLSPQYLLWVVGLAAACLATGRTTQRPVALAVLAAAGLTQLIFPIGWHSLVGGSDSVTGRPGGTQRAPGRGRRPVLLAAARHHLTWPRRPPIGARAPARVDARCRQVTGPAGPAPR